VVAGQVGVGRDGKVAGADVVGQTKQAFENVRYPILPKVARAASEAAWQDILEIRHSSLYAPRDFDISPYFEVVKPTLVKGFDYKAMAWADLPVDEGDELMSLVSMRSAEDESLSPAG